MTLFGKPRVRVPGFRFANGPTENHYAVVAVTGGEQMQVSLPVNRMFRERGVNCIEHHPDAVGNMDAGRDTDETSLKPAWARTTHNVGI